MKKWSFAARRDTKDSKRVSGGGWPLSGLYAIVDPEHSCGHDPLMLARQLLQGGCGALQLRAKKLDDGEYVDLARAMAAECYRQRVPFFVNDRAHLVQAIGADGLHVGQSDLPIQEARQMLPKHWLGLSTHSEDQAEQAFRNGAVDLIGFGPVFATRTKLDADKVVGLQTLQRICAHSPLPVVAIGGLDEERAELAFAAGATMVAMISALAQASCPQQTAANVHAMHGARRPVDVQGAKA